MWVQAKARLRQMSRTAYGDTCASRSCETQQNRSRLGLSVAKRPTEPKDVTYPSFAHKSVCNLASRREAPASRRAERVGNTRTSPTRASAGCKTAKHELTNGRIDERI
eukprot:3419233-Pleurochrysis_carterae.AAC.1